MLSSEDVMINSKSDIIILKYNTAIVMVIEYYDSVISCYLAYL